MTDRLSINCLELKERLQEAWAERYAQMTLQEQISLRAKCLRESDKPLARWWRGEAVSVPPELEIKTLVREAREREAAKPPKEFDCVEMKRRIQESMSDALAQEAAENDKRPSDI